MQAKRIENGIVRLSEMVDDLFEMAKIKRRRGDRSLQIGWPSTTWWSTRGDAHHIAAERAG